MPIGASRLPQAFSCVRGSRIHPVLMPRGASQGFATELAGRTIRPMSDDLERFVIAQAHVYDGALEELRRGRKTGHWIWFIFPQIGGLGSSEMSQRFAISSLDEARAYLAHPELGARLRACAATLVATENRTAEDIFGALDAMKVRSSMTLFHRAAPDEPLFAEVLARFYGGVPDARTDALLAPDSL